MLQTHLGLHWVEEQEKLATDQSASVADDRELNAQRLELGDCWKQEQDDSNPSRMVVVWK